MKHEHDHHNLNDKITMRDLRTHLIQDHNHPTAHLTNDFVQLNDWHKVDHTLVKGVVSAPDYKEMK